MEPTTTAIPDETPPVIREHIVRTPGTCGGKPRIAGSRIQVKDVVIWHERMGQTANQIVSESPHLTLADVYAALTYYHDHREEIHADIQAERNRYEQVKAARPSLVREKQKLERQEADAPDDSISSR